MLLVLLSVEDVEARICGGRNGNSFANVNASTFLTYLEPNNSAMLKTVFFSNSQQTRTVYNEGVAKCYKKYKGIRLPFKLSEGPWSSWLTRN